MRFARQRRGVALKAEDTNITQTIDCAGGPASELTLDFFVLAVDRTAGTDRPFSNVAPGVLLAKQSIRPVAAGTNVLLNGALQHAGFRAQRSEGVTCGA